MPIHHRSADLKRASLRTDRRGVALIEFALSLPVLMVLILVGLEVTNFILSQHQVRAIAAMTADNASRLRTQMNEAYVNQLFVGVQKAGSGIDFEEKGRVVLSSVQNNTAGNGQWIRWQRCFGDLAYVSKYGAEGKGQSDTSLPDVNGLAAQAGSAMMYAEVEYQYEPLIPSSFLANRMIEHEVAFVVRQRTDFSIAATPGQTASTC
jgi:hypothetical protein